MKDPMFALSQRLLLFARRWYAVLANAVLEKFGVEQHDRFENFNRGI